MLTATDYYNAEQNGICAGTLSSRIYAGWDKAKACTEPIQSNERSEWLNIAKQNGIKQATFDKRVYVHHWSFEKAATKKTGNRVRMAQVDQIDRLIESL